MYYRGVEESKVLSDRGGVSVTDSTLGKYTEDFEDSGGNKKIKGHNFYLPF